jgi:predicted dinucleotide-binding enzyme
MNVAMIGAGNVGSALAGALTKARHTVTITATTAEKAKRVAGETGAQAESGNREAVQDADVVVVAVPNQAVDEVVREIGDALDGKVVVDTTNRFDPSGSTLDGMSVTERIKEQAPGAGVAKAFNTVFAAHMDDPRVDGEQVDLLVAGDERARSAVRELGEDIGFRVIDAGDLVAARVLEGMAFLNISLNMQEGWAWSTEWKLVGPVGPGT